MATLAELEERKRELKIGARFIEKKSSKERGSSKFLKDNWEWFHDERIGGVINYETRPHIIGDLQRYLWCSTYAKVKNKSPRLNDFPEKIYPDHKNPWPDAFKVQLRKKPSNTITSHISRDGHYFIHYDPLQCRSFTVREAARIQTFPDNYFFEGKLTNQRKQVGNAVPPLLARKLAHIVFQIIKKSGKY